MNSEITVQPDYSIIQILILNYKFDFVPTSATGKLFLRMLQNSGNFLQDFLGKTSFFIPTAKTRVSEQNLILKHTSKQHSHL